MTLIQFDIGSGSRIADVVQYVEGQANRRRPLNFEPAMSASSQKLFRICTFTGSWAIGSSKTVTFKNQTNTPNTASVTNLFFPINSAPPAAKDCAIAKDGTAWYLIDVPLRTATAVFITSTNSQNVVASVSTANQSVMSDVSISASLNTSNCTISIGKTATTTNVSVVSGVSTARITVVTGTATGTYLQLDL